MVGTRGRFCHVQNGPRGSLDASLFEKVEGFTPVEWQIPMVYYGWESTLKRFKCK